MNKDFTYEIEWTVTEIKLRKKFIRDKWTDLSNDAIIKGFNPCLYEHSDIKQPKTLISVSAYKSPPWFVRIPYLLCHRGSFSFLPRWRGGTS